MSTQQTSEYKAFKGTLVGTVPAFVVMRGDRRIDFFQSEAAAHYAARILNDGRATIDLHAPLGCRVVPR